MPIYEYRCDNGHTFDVRRSFADPPLTACVECGAPVQKVLHAPSVHFKGSGFYNTDYGTAKRKREMDKSAASGADTNDTKTKEKSEAKASSNGSSSSDGGSSSSSSSESTPSKTSSSASSD